MTEIPLQQFVMDVGTVEAARRLGVTPPAISKAISCGRCIVVVAMKGGKYRAEERRPFPAQRARSNQ